MTTPARPDIYAYTAFRQYLADWFGWKKAGKAPYSHRIFAKRLGSKDPSVLSNIINGHRKLAETRIPLFAKAMDLDEDETEYFTLLVRLGQAGPGEEHERAWAALTEHRVRREGPSIDPEQVRVLSNWYFAAIRTMAECVGFRPEPSWVAARLRHRVDAETAAEAIEILERLGWLNREGVHVTPATPSIQSAELVAQYGSYGFHRDILRLASRVMDDLHEPKVEEETAFLGMTLAVPESRIPDLRRMLWEALSQTLHRVDGWPDERDRVVQVSLQLYPLSETTTP